MIYPKNIVLATSIALLFGCKSDPKKIDNPATESFNPTNTETVVFLKSLDGCSPKEEGCTYYLVQYPRFGGDNATVLNQFIDSIKSPAFDPDRQFDPLDELADEFLTTYREYKTEFPQDKETWFLNYIISVVSEDEEYITISGEISEYGGGAHGNYFVVYHIVNKQSGIKLKLSDLYSEAQISQMSPILSVSINPEITLFSETIYPNQNFILSADSITFVYNPYEIAPFSEGVIRLSLPRVQDLNM